MSDVKHTKKKNKISFDAIVMFLLTVCVFSVFGFLAGRLLAPFIHSPRTAFISFGLLLLWLSLNMFFGVVIHELGHLFFGLLSGYKFVSFRIFSFVFVWRGGRLHLCRYSVPGTAGQCLLEPPGSTFEKAPTALYNAGGSLFNLLVACAAFCLYMQTNSRYIDVLCLVVFIMNLYYFLTNLVPLKMGGVANDGYNMLTLGRGGAQKRAFWVQLKINALLTQGERLKNIDTTYFEFDAGTNLSDVLLCAQAINRISFIVDNHDFKQAACENARLLESAQNMLPIYKLEAQREQLYLLLMLGSPREKIEELYTKELKKYMKQSIYSLQVLRTLYAVELLFDEQAEAAAKTLARFEHAVQRYHIEGDKVSEDELVAAATALAQQRANEVV